MKIINYALIICSTFFFPLPTTAQKFTMKWTDATRTHYFSDKTAVAVSDNSNDAIIMEMKPDYKKMDFMAEGRFYIGKTTLYRIDEKTNVIKTTELELEEKYALNSSLIRLGRNCYILYSSFNKTENKTTFHSLKINESNLAVENKIELGSLVSDKKFTMAESGFEITPDSSKLMIWMENPESKKSKKIFLAVYDDKMQASWSSKVDFETPDRKLHISDFNINNDGKVFVSLIDLEYEYDRFYIKEDSKLPAYTSKLIIYDKDHLQGKIAPLEFEGKNLKHTKLYFDDNGTIFIAALYRQAVNQSIDGVAIANINSNSGNISGLKFFPYPNTLASLIDRDGFGPERKTTGVVSRRFSISHILKRKNGSIDVITEYKKSDFVTTGKTPAIHYNYGDVINTNISTSGKAIFTRVPKDQLYVDATYYLSVYPYVYLDKLILFYNEGEGNLSRDIASKPNFTTRFRKSSLVAGIIDTEGNLKREVIMDHKDDDFISNPATSTLVDANTIQFNSIKRRLFKQQGKVALLEIN